MRVDGVRRFCERAYRRYHRLQYLSPDPLEVVRDYPRLADREVVGLIASSLALGRVDGIVRAVREVTARIEAAGGTPAEVVAGATGRELRACCEGFRYRFFDAEQLCGLLTGLQGTLRDHGSLEACFRRCAIATSERDPSDAVVTGLAGMVEAVVGASRGRLSRSILLPRPDRASACKRLMLYLRWMVRSDEIDPGGWSSVDPSALLMPVDTHLLRVARALGLTSRLQPSLSVSREITRAMRAVDPVDPVRFDFCLTRPGIHPLIDERQWLARDTTRESSRKPPSECTRSA